MEQVTKGAEAFPGSGEIWTVNVDGANARRLTSGHEDEHPRFSPDGRAIVFTRDEDIWIINADGTELRNLTNTKDTTEAAPEFTNDGQSVLFLREGSTKLEIDAMLEGKSTKEVVLRNVGDGRERVLLKDISAEQGGFDVKQVVPNPTDDNAVLLLSRPLGADGKPVKGDTEDRVIAVLKLDGSAPRTLFAPKAGSKMIIHSMRITPARMMLEIGKPDEIGQQVGLVEKDEIVLLGDALFFGDVTQDGTGLVGIGMNNETFGSGSMSDT